MSSARGSWRWRSGLLAALAAVVAVVAAGCGSSSSGTATAAGSTGLVRSNHDAQLGTVLVNRQGMTLYALSAEKNGKFICTSANVPGTSTPCTMLWHPLTAKAGQSLGGGVAHLATVRRPGSSALQVTYRGMPLYTFAEDHSAGQASGNGFHDVGTWHVVTVAGTASATPAQTTSGGGYGY